MLETSAILNNATAQSLIILDEIGRGTSTFDGLSIAAAVAKFIYNEIKATTLFATHYHEMTSLVLKYPNMKNMNVAIVEDGDRIRFTYKVIPGKAEKSYGIHVADIAGLPRAVIQEAWRILKELEQEQISLYKDRKSEHEQLLLF